MRRSTHPPAPDQAQRDGAIAERRRNVIVDAGAGTGKTTLVVSRLVELVAPTDGSEPLALGRIAAVTFTRRAAGELKLRVRERLLSELAARGDGPRRRMLLDALGVLDTAYIGTIHSFADRLLRMRPMEARLSPAYDIAEDTDALVRETFLRLVQGAETGTLADALSGHPAADLAVQTEETVLDALEAGIPSESKEGEFWTKEGLDGLVAALIGSRDVRHGEVPVVDFDAAAFRKMCAEYFALVAPLVGDTPGVTRMRAIEKTLRSVQKEKRPAVIMRELRWALRLYGGDAKMGRDFDGDKSAWAAWKRFDRETDGVEALRDRLRVPLDRWMAHRLARLEPVVVALYERVKARHQVVDQVDLLLELRDLLARDREARRFYQGLFDHVFVDEFQDTDPLQAEILMYLCEREPVAATWKDVALTAGKLTVVGDPKQSIYRFRRADVAMYDEVRALVAAQGALEAELTASFRSRPKLIEWLNHRFAVVLGSPEDGQARFDAQTGKVYHRDLLPGRSAPSEPAVHAVPFDVVTGGGKADDYRELEGEVMPRYLRWLVRESGFEVQDPLSGKQRPVRYGDVAVLAISTTKLPFLFPALDELGIPHVTAGGTLFLEDALHRQFLLGLRALADRDDGVAEAALLRPPFFAVDLRDLVLERAATRGGATEGVEIDRARAARAQVRELRRRRFERGPGATARDLLEGTAFARTVAAEPNGTQRLWRLRELCLILEELAATEGLDFDAATARMREWVSDPIQIDPPMPVAGDAVQILTVHQAKGLEFPVVVLWDGRALWGTKGDTGAWRVDRDGRAWVLGLDDLEWEEPRGFGLKEREGEYRNAERERVVYVAATRARDLLVIPMAGQQAPGKHVCATLLDDAPKESVLELSEYGSDDAEAWWDVDVKESRAAPTTEPSFEPALDERWAEARAEAARPRWAPIAVSTFAHELAAAQAEEDEVSDMEDRPPRRQGRYGTTFGSTVHRALEELLRRRARSVEEAVATAAGETGLAEHLDEARADVTRTLHTLEAEGLLGDRDVTLRLEYPIAGAGDDGRLLNGYIDLLAAMPGQLLVLDFKTDQPPDGGDVTKTHPAYVEQVRAYARLLTAAGVVEGRAVRCGLLFTAEGAVRWVE